jgi:uncharacterized lipoprotein YddW (UPF0748 family)
MHFGNPARTLVSRRRPAPPALLRMFAAFWVLSFAGAGAAEPVSPVFASCNYADSSAARKAWQPMGATDAAGSVEEAGRQVLRLPCRFAGKTIERASWDLAVRLDLSACRGIQFEFFCQDPSPVTSFSLYLQSGKGWYHASFYPDLPGWNTIVIDKAGAHVEGQPDGWASIQTIRLSAWRGGHTDTELRVRDFAVRGMLGVDAQVAILRAESVALRQPTESRTVDSAAEGLARHLDALGIGCATLSDLKLSPAQLQHVRLVVLPHNPSLPDEAASALDQFARAGGKVLSFYGLPAQLRAALKIEPGPYVKQERPGSFTALRFADGAVPGAPPVVGQRSWNITVSRPAPGAGKVLADWLDDQGQPTGHAAIVATANGMVMSHILLDDDAVNKRRMLQAMLGYLVPDLWRQAVDGLLARMGRLGAYREFDELANELARTRGDDQRVSEALGEARRLRAEAKRLLGAGQSVEAFAAATAADQQALAAYARAQRAVPGEFRGLWCHNAHGVSGLTWDAAIKQLADNGFTAIVPNMLWGGVAYYPSEVLPVADGVTAENDEVAKCLAACRKYGIQIHVWKVNWNLGWQVPAGVTDKLRRAGRLQVSSAGKEEPWLCPSHPENQKLEVDSLVEVARRYAVDGLHFDYIRYPDGDHCYCAGCRERFAQVAGAALANWPEDVRRTGPLRQRWLDWRRDNISTVVREVGQQARKVRPGIKLSAAVFRNWTSDRDSVGQDWKLWCERGWLDFVCPMDYTPSDVQLGSWVTSQQRWAGKTPCYPGVAVFEHGRRSPFDHTLQQILLTRRQQTGGFMVFDYGDVHRYGLLPLLGQGATRRE